MPFSSLDLSLDTESDDAVRAGWQALEQCEIPSEGRRTSPTHRPHLTLLAAQTVSPELLERAARELRTLLPARLTVQATVVFGRGPFVVAHLVAADPALRAAVSGLRNDEDGPWIPHLTLSRKVPADRLNDALRAAGSSRPSTTVLDQLQHWDAVHHIVTRLT